MMRIPRRSPLHGASDAPVSMKHRSPIRMHIFLPALIYLIGLQIQAVQADWVDPDTPEAGRKTKALSPGDNREYELVSKRAVT